MPFAMPFAMRLLRAAAPAWPSHRGWFRLARLARDRVPAGHRQGVFTTAMNTRLRLDLNDYPDFSMAPGVYERSTVRLVQKLLKPGMHLVDCGANLGYFTTLAAKIVGPTGRIDAFEPDPINRQRLIENVALNDASQIVRVHECAVGDRADVLRMSRAQGDFANHGESSLASSNNTETFEVRLCRADAVIERKPDLVKIDVEGFEALALSGMSEWFADGPSPRLIIECNRGTLERAGSSPTKLLELIRTLRPGAVVYEIDWPMRKVNDATNIDSQDRNWFVEK